jgi:DNA-binding PadR family transcriptional regulator
MGTTNEGAEGAETHTRHQHGHGHGGGRWLYTDGPWPDDRRWPAGERSGRRGSRRGPGGGWGGPGPWGGARFGGPRRARGDVRLAILAPLTEQPMHGYQMIQEIAERSGGRWQPSPGSVYPTLQALEDEGLVRATRTDDKRVYELTDAGREQVEALGDRVRAPWDLDGDEAVGARELAEQMGQFAGAFKQVLRSGSPAQHARARDVLSDAKRALYQILADDDVTTPDPD